MAEKLELKHLAPYQLHQLKVMDLYDDKVSILSGIGKTEANYKIEIYRKDTIILTRFLSEVKPILRPLVDITQDIILNGERFNPILKIIEDAYDLTWCDDFQMNHKGSIIIDSMDEYTLALDDILKHVEFLFEWHFDVFGLIEKWLAIDINTI